MRPRSFQTTTPSGTKKSRARYGENSPSQSAKEKAEQSVRRAVETFQRDEQTTSAKTISADKIAERAHSIWQREGQPGGRDQEFWFRAEAELKSERAAQLKL
jgi:hypothetical protein